MEPRREEKSESNTPRDRTEKPKPKLQIVKLEPRIAPRGTGCTNELICGRSNHNETLVRDCSAKEKAAEDRTEAPKPKLQIVKLEPRIAPKPIPSNHNETLVREPAKAKPVVAKSKKPARRRVVKLENRIAPGTTMQHNETLVRDRA